jgi:esterase
MKLFYRKFGEGPALIILHGLYGASDNWVTIAKSLSDTFTVYLPDQRNHGQSPHSDIHDYGSMSDDLFELVTDLHLKKFFLAGHSMGGKTAIAFAFKWPELINGLMVMDISPFSDENTRLPFYTQHLTILNAILSLDLERVHSRADADSLLSGNISSERIRNFILKNLERNPGNTFTWKINASSLHSNLDKIMEGIDLKEGFIQPVTGFPVVFLKGGSSGYILASDITDIRKVFPAAEFIVINGAGHWLHYDKPDEVINNLRNLVNDY